MDGFGAPVTRIGTRSFHEKPPFDDAAAAALAPIEAAGPQALSRSRVYEVRCPRQPTGHRLAEVFRTRHGLVVRGLGAFLYVLVDREGGDRVPGPDGGWIDQDWEVEKRHVIGKHRGAPLCVFLGPTLPSGHVGLYVVECRCRTALLYGIAMIEDIEAGRGKSIIYYGER
ncbi:hypothetical protein [Actinoplanes sp. CA-252034]|uniref:hypothetical protein n=1 Tax=Actinoplanes sp. CA-252034 TaxID=3239906 RepID=UPI003D96B932